MKKSAIVDNVVDRKSGRRELILETTLQMIARGGIDAITHRKVANAAGIPLGSTTYYFESREHLLRETFDYYIEQVRHLYTRPGRIDSVAEFVAYLVEVTKRELEEEEALLLAEYEMTLFAARNDQVAESLHAWDKTMLKEIASTLRSLGATKPTDAARTLLHVMRGYELERLSRHNPDSAGLARRLTVIISAFVEA